MRLPRKVVEASEIYENVFEKIVRVACALGATTVPALRHLCHTMKIMLLLNTRVLMHKCNFLGTSKSEYCSCISNPKLC